MRTVELASLGSQGKWEYLGNYNSVGEAMDVARDRSCNEDMHRDDAGKAIFGITEDSDGGYYEIRYEVHEDGSTQIARVGVRFDI